MTSCVCNCGPFTCRNFYKDDDTVDEDERDYAGIYGEDDENEYEAAFDDQEYDEEDIPHGHGKRARRQAPGPGYPTPGREVPAPGPGGIKPSGDGMYGPEGPP